MTEPGAPDKKKTAQALKDWARRVQRWLLTEEDVSALREGVGKPASVTLAATPQGWEVDRAALIQQVWGKGWHLPLGEQLADLMTTPFGLNHETTVLDLAAGFGGACRYIATTYKGFAVGLEADSTLAAEGARLCTSKRASVTLYDPEHFKAERRYDGVIMRELLHGVADKPRLVKEISASVKERGHVAWTDFVLRDDAAAPADSGDDWLEQDAGAATPLRVSEVLPLFAERGLMVRVSEDLTQGYNDAVLAGLAMLLQTLKGKQIADRAKPMIMAEVDHWAGCAAALTRGLRFYRFYADKA